MTSTSSVSASPGHPSLCAGDPAWLRAVLVFNLSPVAYADPSWLPDARWSDTARARRQACEALLAERGLAERFTWEPRGTAARLMLLSAAAGAELALAVGVMAHRQRLRQVVRRELLQQWREMLGEWMDLLWHPLAERVPIAPMRCACAQPGEQAEATLREDGQAVVLALLDPDDDAQVCMRQRACLRLPRERVIDLHAWMPRLARPQADALAEGLAALGLPPEPSSPSSSSPLRSPPWTWLS